LLHCAHELHVRWDLTQCLHLVYLCERLLQCFNDRGAKFHLIAFDEYDALYASAPQLRLARSILLQRLEAASAQHGFHFKRFDDWTRTGKGSYVEYHSRHLPEFVLVNDGEQLAGLAPTEFQLQSSTDRHRLLDTKSDAAAAAMQLFAAVVIGLKTHVVFNSRLVFKDNDILGFLCRAQSTRFVPSARYAPVSKRSRRCCLSRLPLPRRTWMYPSCSSTAPRLASSVSRDLLVIPSLAALLRTNPEYGDLIKGHIVTLVVVAPKVVIDNRGVGPITIMIIEICGPPSVIVIDYQKLSITANTGWARTVPHKHGPLEVKAPS
jgi:hypothetical protein